MESSKRIVDINGVKMEIDFSTARRIDEFRVGDNVKVLRKEYDSYQVYSGVIVEFVNFKSRPTIVIAIFKDDYSGATIEFLYYHEETTEFEITPAGEHELLLEKSRLVDKFNDQIASRKAEIDELQSKRDYFIKHFAKYFGNE